MTDTRNPYKIWEQNLAVRDNFRQLCTDGGIILRTTSETEN
jgi:hypothetical protein